MQKKSAVVGSILQVVVIALASVFGMSMVDDTGQPLGILQWLLGLSLPAQVGILIAVGLLAGMPWLARYTPWTWDDQLKEYQGPVKKFFLAIWNALAANDGYATNTRPVKKPKSDIQPLRR